MPELFAGAELGGTKCILLLARGPDDILAREQLPTTSPQATLAQMEDILRDWQSSHGFAALGIGSFGPLDLDLRSPTHGQIRSTPKPGWSGAKVLSRLAAAASVPAVIDTDVNGAALAEIRWGSGRGLADFAYITVGTGIGVGLIVNGLPTRGFAHCELGHIRPVRLPGDEWPGSCPFHGDCVEGLASGPAIKARLASLETPRSGVQEPVWESVCWALAQLCHVIVCAAAPQTIAIGGGVIEGNPQLVAKIETMLVESLADYVELPAGTYVRQPALGTNAGPLGAIALAMTAKR